MTVLWSDNAIEQLESIFEYYNYKSGIVVAKKITKNIVKRTLQLERNPKSGQREKLLVNRKNEYRYIVEGNYKIIYWVDIDFVKIASVFDCRQNPIKIIKA